MQVDEMSLPDLIGAGIRVLSEGSVYELLRRDPRVRFDDSIAHAGLIYDMKAREILASIHRTYLGIAADAGLPALSLTDTWRASAERIARSPFRGRDVNSDNVRFLREITFERPGRVFVAGMCGPRGDAYRPAEAPSSEEATRYHAAQIERLSQAAVDLLFAATLPAFGEACGIADLMAGSGVPWMLSFVIRRDATLLDGTPLERAIGEIDGRTPHPPIGYSLNCIHPLVLRDAMSRMGSASRRVVAFQANTSARTPDELDRLPEIESAEPEAFADLLLSVTDRAGVAVVGGCCGTDPSHMRALAARMEGKQTVPSVVV